MSNTEVINYLEPYEDIPQYAKKVLAAMFSSYNEVTVNKRFGRGLSGSLVYIVQPDGELPNVVKIDYYEKIIGEWQAFTKYIRNKVPNAVLSDGEPVCPPGSIHAGLRYPLAGYGVFQVQGLYDFWRERDAADSLKVLDRLFTILKTLYSGRQETSLRLQVVYDNALPQNLIIDCAQAGHGATWFGPDDSRANRLRVDDMVQVAPEWEIVEYLRGKSGLELRHPNPRYAFRMQVINVGDVTQYEVGQTLKKPVIGKVIATRSSIFEEAVRRDVGANIDVNASILPTFHNFPNPLYYLNQQLNRTVRGFFAPIHGDLNLENVIVEPSIANAHLIDFAKARPDHVIRDLLHLEMNIATTLLTEEIIATGYDANKIKAFYERLHCAAKSTKVDAPAGLEKPFTLALAIRQEAQAYLVNRDSSAEYEQALFLYLLGSLRYGTVAKQPGLNTLAKQTAFYGAAAVLNIIQNPDSVNCASFTAATAAEATSATRSATSTSTTLPHATAASAPPRPFSEMRLSDMRNAIVQSFAENELRDFIFDLGIDPEQLGRYKSELARELIEYFRRRNNLETLQRALYTARPDATWWG